MSLSKLTLTLALLFATSTAFARKQEWATYTVNWAIKGSLYQGHTGMCDDSNYAGFHYIVPGQSGRDFNLSFKMDSDCKVVSIRPFNQNGHLSTEISVKGQCQGTIEAEQKSGLKLKAILDLTDAC